MAIKKTKKLSTLIIFVVAATITVLNIAQILFLASKTKAITTKSYEEECTELTKAYAERLSGKMTEYFALLSAYTNADIVKTGNNARIKAWLENHADIRPADFDYVAWVDSDGNFDSDKKSHAFVKDRDYFIEIMQNGKDTAVDNPVTSKTTGKTVIHVCKAAKVDGKTIGFFCAVMETHSFNKLVSDVKFGETGTATLLSSSQKIISTSGNEEQVTADIEAIYKNPAILQKIEDDKSQNKISTFWAKNARNSKSFIVTTQIEDTPWFFNFMIDQSQVYRTSNYIRNIMFAIGIAVIIILSIIVWVIVYIYLKPLNTVQSTINEIAEGNADLTKRIKLTTKNQNEISQVVESFNKFSQKLQEIMSQLKDSKNKLVDSGVKLNETSQNTTSAIIQISANLKSIHGGIDSQSTSVAQTAGAVNEITANIRCLNSMIDNQTQSVSQAASAVEEMIGNIKAVSSSVDKMAESFTGLEKNAKVGVEKQNDVNILLTEIQSESTTLQEANTVISSIANQTNLLAMNAAIEAAHAGEAGQGFAVVADEIRKLSENSTIQSKRIGEQLKKITQTISNIVSASSQTGIVFDSISDDIEKTNVLVRQIKSAMEEQNEGSKQITGALSEMNDSTYQVKNASSEMDEGNKAILAEVQTLQDVSLSLKQAMEGISIGTTKINETGMMLSEITSEVKDQIEQIGKEVDLFKV